MLGESIDMESSIEEKNEKKETIIDYLIISLKETIKFAIIGIISLFSVGLLSVYIFLEIFRVGVEIAGLIAGIITAITIFIIDIKKLHSSDKIVQVNFKIMNMIKEKGYNKRRI